MKKDGQHIDDLFAKAFKGANAKPTEGLWENIEQKIESRSIIHDVNFMPLSDAEAKASLQVWERIESRLKEKKRRTLWWYFYASGSVAAVVLVLFGLLQLNESPNDSQIFADRQIQSNQEVAHSELDSLPIGNDFEKLNDNHTSPKTQSVSNSNGAFEAERARIENMGAIPAENQMAASIDQVLNKNLEYANNSIPRVMELKRLPSLPVDNVPSELGVYAADLAHQAGEIKASESDAPPRKEYVYDDRENTGAYQASLFAQAQIGASFSPNDFYFSNYNPNGLKNLSANAIRSSEPVANISAAFNYNGGLGVEVAEHFIIQTGINYAQWNGSAERVFNGRFYSITDASTNESASISESEFQSSMRINESNSGLNVTGNENLVTAQNQDDQLFEVSVIRLSDTASANYQFRFIEIPLEIGFQMPLNKLFFAINAGLSANIRSRFIANDFEDVFDAYSLNVEDAAFPIQFNITMSAGMGYALSKRIALMVQPRYMHNISSSAFESSYQVQTFTLASGIKYKF